MKNVIDRHEKNQGMNWMTGQIRVGDGVVGYDATLVGEWTPEQVRAAFADGYDWDEANEFTMSIFDESGNQLARLAVWRGSEYGDYPHTIEWK